MRISHSKLSAVRAFQSINYETIAVGDSYNDLEMLNASKKGFLFHASDKMKAENPNLIPIDDFDSLYEAIMQSL
jgi:phosphoserine/homoserine phosphotransferase